MKRGRWSVACALVSEGVHRADVLLQITRGLSSAHTSGRTAYSRRPGATSSTVMCVRVRYPSFPATHGANVLCPRSTGCFNRSLPNRPRSTARGESVKPDHEKPTVTLEPGKTLAADVLIGADGLMLEGFQCRPAVMEAIEQEDTHVPTRLQFFQVRA